MYAFSHRDRASELDPGIEPENRPATTAAPEQQADAAGAEVSSELEAPLDACLLERLLVDGPDRRRLRNTTTYKRTLMRS
jgi:hypothetical protein